MINCSIPSHHSIRSLASELSSLQLTHFHIFLILELLLLVGSALWVLATLTVFCNTYIFHANCHRIMANLMVHYILFHFLPRVTEISLMYWYHYICSEDNQSDEYGIKAVVGVVIAANIVALLVSAYCDRRSIKYYKKCAKVEPKNGNILYSLSERFQCAENVRIAKMLRKLILFSGALNLALGSVYTLRMIKAEYILPLYINYELFDSAIALYAILVPMIVYRRSKIFRTKMKALPAKCVRYIICIKPADRHKAQEEQRSSSETVIHPMGGSRIQLENVLGVKLTQISSYHETEVYFEQLLRSWNPKSKVPEIVKKAQLEKIDVKRDT
ncbi:sre G protein-coupled chemoreceptor domain-containing protein [Ditylenchus destructor]|uniref:Sre G protein-coupled chemoreceptor domain-containing protein n=1 Tax=Ditylenchus destructor TaxID=166010 RepID=A0AAD4MV58_9BILA|nr:sre G protein-coupled chemoreceptor domain-containing protein [Ditylenchus destructor]